MPWKIVPRDGKFDVVNEQTGAVKCTEPTRAKAEAYLRALYANVPEASAAAKGPTSGEEAAEPHDSPAEDAREHDRMMRSGGPTGMMKKKKKPKGIGRSGSMNPPMLPTPPGPQNGQMPGSNQQPDDMA